MCPNEFQDKRSKPNWALWRRQVNPSILEVEAGKSLKPKINQGYTAPTFPTHICFVL